MTCKHDFDFHIGVAIFEDKPGQGSVDITGKCKHCGVPLIFYGPRGANAPYPVMSPDRTELRAPVTFGYAPKFQPGPTMLINGPEIVPSEKNTMAEARRMADRLTWKKRRDRADKLLAKLQECENECHAIGFTRAAHSVNAAKNQVGWDFADEAATQIAAGRRDLQSGGDE